MAYIKFGEIDASQILENEFRINVLERILEWVFRSNRGRLTLPTEQDIAQIRKDVLAVLQKKYPNSGIDLKGREEQPVAG